MRTYHDLRSFYKGDDWQQCKAQVLNDRLRGGEVRCEYCGEIIVKSFNPNKNNNAGAMVFHHVIPLTKLNVNDAAISINPANIQILHWQCHNKVHKRFCNGSTLRSDQKVYLVTGAPCSGKTTFARERMSEGDILIDIDDIWQQVTGLPRYQKPNSAKPIVFATLKAQTEQIAMRAGNWYNAFIIEGLPLRMDRERKAQELNADEVIIMDTTREECLARLHADPKGRDLKEYESYINKYYQRFVAG
jgi:predicted kinase